MDQSLMYKEGIKIHVEDKPLILKFRNKGEMSDKYRKLKKDFPQYDVIKEISLAKKKHFSQLRRDTGYFVIIKKKENEKIFTLTP